MAIDTSPEALAKERAWLVSEPDAAIHKPLALALIDALEEARAERDREMQAHQELLIYNKELIDALKETDQPCLRKHE